MMEIGNRKTEKLRRFKTSLKKERVIDDLMSMSLEDSMTYLAKKAAKPMKVVKKK